MSRERWMAASFAVGSTCFLIGPFPGYAELVGERADAITFFVGSILFTSAAFLQLVQSTDPVDWWASAIQLAGTIWFNINTFDADPEMAWTILGQLVPAIAHVYGYTLEPIDEGTLVTSYYDWSDIHPQWREANIFPIIPETALRATLGILARTAGRNQRAAEG